MGVSSRFTRRDPRFAAVDHWAGWRVKWYDMSVDGAAVPEAVKRSAEDVVRSALAGRADSDTGVGFAVLHAGAEAVWLMCDTWTGDMLCHQLWRADLGAPTEFHGVGPGGPTACVHELVVFAHERDAFVTHVLEPDPPDRDGYLADVWSPVDASPRTRSAR